LDYTCILGTRTLQVNNCCTISTHWHRNGGWFPYIHIIPCHCRPQESSSPAVSACKRVSRVRLPVNLVPYPLCLYQRQQPDALQYSSQQHAWHSAPQSAVRALALNKTAQNTFSVLPSPPMCLLFTGFLTIKWAPRVLYLWQRRFNSDVT